MDKRGWVLACASGLACVVGSSIICLDLICQCVPRWRHFKVRESTTFLAASLSLSFGVMFFSALYGMLPKALQYLLEGGLAPSVAGTVLIAVFLAGVSGLQLVSELLHYCLPSSIVNCDQHGKEHERFHEDEHLEITIGHAPLQQQRDERTPLLARQSSIASKISVSVSSFVKRCSHGGKCYGFSDHDCEQKCALERQRLLEGQHTTPSSGSGSITAVDLEQGVERTNGAMGHDSHGHHHRIHNPQNSPHGLGDLSERVGHHHVADNKFLSIGVQTSIAIALHKIPEGFITYATNHANPELGFAVFLAIFIHNIAEGFAMSLPLFLALDSRLWAVVWSSLLGGLSQPLGAGLAALSMKDRDNDLNNHKRAYGFLFAATAGIMCSVGLQLFSQAVQIHHGQRLPFIFGFLGMGLLGVSFALTA